MRKNDIYSSLTRARLFDNLNSKRSRDASLGKYYILARDLVVLYIIHAQREWCIGAEESERVETLFFFPFRNSVTGTLKTRCVHR